MELSYESVLMLIPFGKNNAVTRTYLSGITGISDRMVRKMIENARRDGNLIINDSDGKGYYRSDDLEDIKRQYINISNRAFSLLKTRKEYRKVLKENGIEC